MFTSSNFIVCLKHIEFPICFPYTYGHSGIDETHISFETNCLLHLNIAAFSGIRYDLVRILSPLPQVTEQLDQAVYSVVWHSAENNKKIRLNVKRRK